MYSKQCPTKKKTTIKEQRPKGPKSGYKRRSVLKKGAAAGVLVGGDFGIESAQLSQTRPKTDVKVSGPPCITEEELYQIVVESANERLSYYDLIIYLPDELQINQIYSLMGSWENVEKQFWDGRSTVRIKDEAGEKDSPTDPGEIEIVEFHVECKNGGSGMISLDHRIDLRTPDGIDYRTVTQDKQVAYTTNETVVKIKGDYESGIKYEFEVEGGLEKISCDCSVNDADIIDGNTAEGYVTQGCDSYGYSNGDREFVRFASEDRGMTVELWRDFDEDPKSVTTGRLSGLVEEHTLTIEEQQNNWVNYEMEVSGDIQKSDALNASINATDTISGNTATGGLKGGRDSYVYTGDLSRFAADADVSLRVLLDGGEVVPSEIVSEHTLTIDEPNGNWVDYEFEVDGEVRKSDALNASINRSDEISGGTVSGTLHGGRDSYVYSGNLENFEPDGDVTVYIDGIQWFSS